MFLKKLLADVLDRVDQFDDFDPRRLYALTVRTDERAVAGIDDIDLDLEDVTGSRAATLEDD